MDVSIEGGKAGVRGAFSVVRENAGHSTDRRRESSRSDPSIPSGFV